MVEKDVGSVFEVPLWEFEPAKVSGVVLWNERIEYDKLRGIWKIDVAPRFGIRRGRQPGSPLESIRFRPRSSCQTPGKMR